LIVLRWATVRLWTEVSLAGISGVLCVVTIVLPSWLEFVLPIDPDGGDGGLEWWIVGCLFAATMVFGLLSRAHLAVRARAAD
jgi:hypothetical protein